MTQRVPDVDRADVERVVSREFEADQRAAAFALLATFKSNSDRPHRVHLAALKLAHGDLLELRAWITTANEDYRDVLIAAEYPLPNIHSREGHKLSAEERQQIDDANWQQYQCWLRGS